MKLKFCVLCGTKERLHHHHVIPKAQGGTDDEENFITLCRNHHAMIHQVSPTRFNNFQVLAQIGRKNAMARGVKFGRKPLYEHLYAQVTEKYCKEWKGYTLIAKELNMSKSSVRRIVDKFNLRDKRDTKLLFKKYKKNKNGQYKLF